MRGLPKRSSGILLPVASLANGRVDDEAYKFVDWLAKAEQKWWQVLPLNPPDGLGSPYNAGSAFALSEVLGDHKQVSAYEKDAFVKHNAAWITPWLRHSGEEVEVQVRAWRNWQALRAYALRKKVRIIGDLPIFVSADSVEVKAQPELFQKDVVAGVPPDFFTKDGQLWGSPLYDWSVMRSQKYAWWVERVRYSLRLCDVLRLDHFRGFVAYWAVPSSAHTARHGQWRRGPGIALFKEIEGALGLKQLPFIAEDLGVITVPVNQLRTKLGLPGMRVLQFAFDSNESNPHLPKNYTVNTVVYTGTHDNDTALGWWKARTEEERVRSKLAGEDPAHELIEVSWSSVAKLAITPVQDVLGLDGSARINTPGNVYGNWTWRLPTGALTLEHARWLKTLTRQTGR